jgi:hypothetical protein
VQGDSVWFSASLIFFFSFFSLSHTSICALSLKKNHINTLISFPFMFSPSSFNCIFFLKNYFKLEIIFNFIILHCFVSQI